MKHPNVAALMVVGSLAAGGAVHEIDRHKVVPLKPLPLCEQVGDALQTFPPMATAPVAETPVAEPPKASAKKSKKKPVVRRTETFLSPAVPIPAPAPEKPDWGPLTWLFDEIRRFFGIVP